MKYNALVPELTVFDFEKSLNFYTKALGFKVEYQRVNPNFAFLSLRTAQIMIEEKHQQEKLWQSGKLTKPLGRGINFQIEVKNVENLLDRITLAGFKPRRKIKNNTYKTGTETVLCKEFLILDPDGYLLRFSQII